MYKFQEIVRCEFVQFACEKFNGQYTEIKNSAHCVANEPPKRKGDPLTKERSISSVGWNCQAQFPRSQIVSKIAAIVQKQVPARKCQSRVSHHVFHPINAATTQYSNAAMMQTIAMKIMRFSFPVRGGQTSRAFNRAFKISMRLSSPNAMPCQSIRLRLSSSNNTPSGFLTTSYLGVPQGTI